MFERLFGKKTKEVENLPFRSPTEALEYSCRFMDCEIKIGKYLPSIVKNVVHLETGEFALTLKIPSSKGVIDYISITRIISVDYRDGRSSIVVDNTLPDDVGLISDAMVGVYFVAHEPELSYPQCWLGFVVGILEPTWDMKIGWHMTAQFNVE